MKVYCENCRHYKEYVVDGIIYEEYCKNNPTFKDTPTSRCIRYSNCDNKNNNNYCQEFEPSFIYKLKQFFKGIINGRR